MHADSLAAGSQGVTFICATSFSSCRSCVKITSSLAMQVNVLLASMLHMASIHGRA
jgi:hypothetical protein